MIIRIKLMFCYVYRYYVRMSRSFLLVVTVWSVCHVSRGQGVTESVTGDNDYYEGSDGDASDYNDYNSYEVPLLEPVIRAGETGDALPSIRDPYDIPILSENNRDTSETDPYNVPLVSPGVSEPYDIPILSDNVIRTEPEDQQETLPLVREQQGVEEGDMCRLEAGAGAESILMEISESRGEEYSQLTTPRQLPIMGQVSGDIINISICTMIKCIDRLVVISAWS